MSAPWLFPVDPAGWATLEPEVRARLEAARDQAAREQQAATMHQHRTACTCHRVRGVRLGMIRAAISVGGLLELDDATPIPSESGASSPARPAA